MEKVPSCNYDSRDAIYICNDCQLMLCEKHLFSHKNEFSDHDIRHIELPVSNESKKILINFLIKVKQEYNQQIALMPNSKYLFGGHSINDFFTILDNMLLFLRKVTKIPMKIMFRPLDYFLIHPPDKALKYVNNFEFPREFNGSFFKTITDYLVSFNYYRYEGHNYIHVSEYNDSCADAHWSIGWKKAIEFIQFSEYETANEIIQNIYYSREFCPMYTGLWHVTNLLIELTFMLIKEKNPYIIWIKWNLWDESDIQYDDPAYILAYEVVSSIFESLNCQDQMFTFLFYASKTSSIYKEREFLNMIRFEFISGAKYYYYKRDLFKADLFIGVSIDLSRNIKITNNVLLYYKCLGLIYKDIGDEFKIDEILRYDIQSDAFHFEDKILLNYVMGYLYCLVSDFDKAETLLWKCVKDAKLFGKEKYYHLIDTYLLLSDIYHHKGDLIKEGQMIFYAESCCSTLHLNNYEIQEFYIKSANYYQRQCRYEDSLLYLESIEKNCNWPIVKYRIGVAHFNMWNNDKALEIFTELKKSDNPHIKENSIVHLDTLIGKLHERMGNFESADNYFMEAFQIINKNVNKYFDSYDIIFQYFYEKRDYGKCTNIVEKQWKFIKKYPDRKLQLNNHLIHRAQLFISQNRLENAKRWINKLENSLNLNELFYQTRKTFNINNLSVLIDMAEVYIQISDYINAKKILKYCEKFVDKYLRSDLISKINIYRLFGELYFDNKRWKKAKFFYQKWLSMLYQYKGYKPKILEFIKNRLAILRLY